VMHTANVQLVATQGQAGDKLRLRTWIEVQLLDDNDQPVSGAEYAITLPGGKVVQGWLDDQGLARLEGIPPGVCQVSFPKLDKDTWAAAETTSTQASGGKAA
jgi:hypothetical protein